ncbi:MAG: HlyD family efflux transporter periplasmic adaptor subunit [Firmicutes bacterium]|nr:HlyD family efflux transporter periplasmic adaptor subunit [Bacillota bacterium]
MGEENRDLQNAGAGNASGQDAGGHYNRPIFTRGTGSPGPSGGGTLALRGARAPLLSQQGRFILYLLAVLLVMGGVAYYFAVYRLQEKPYLLRSYQTARVEARNFRQLVNGNGTLVPGQQFTVRAPAIAEVDTVRVQPGQDVQEGQVLVQLASADLEKQVLQAERALQQSRSDRDQGALAAQTEEQKLSQALEAAQDTLAKAQARLPGIERLYTLGGASRQELVDARDAVAKAKRDVEAARQALQQSRATRTLARQDADRRVQGAQQDLELARRQLTELTVCSPIAGRVLEVQARPRLRVNPGDSLAIVADVAHQQIKASVDAQDAGSVAVGQPATIRVGSAAYAAVVSEVAPQATGNSQGSTVEVVLKIPQGVPATLRPNTAVGIEIQVGEKRDAPALPRGPYLTSGQSRFVYVVSPDGRRAHRRQVSYGLIDGDYVEVLSGLSKGEVIIYSDYDEFVDRKEIQLAPEGGVPYK